MSTSICATCVALDIPAVRYVASQLDMSCGTKVAHIISNASEASIYRIFVKRKYIEFCKAKYIDEKDVFYMTETKNKLREDAITFAIAISDICDDIKGCSVYVNQIVRSSSSIGANLHEAKYAQSKADFIHKLEISLKECYETKYWLELICRKGKLTQEKYKELRNECGSIRRRLICSITTAKENQEKVL